MAPRCCAIDHRKDFKGVMKNVLIGIQCRSTSNRLPQKAHLPLGGKPIVQWVIDACQLSAKFLQGDNHNLNAKITVALLVPKGDTIVDIYKKQLPVIEGDECDVLSRYAQAAKQFESHIIARITADCAFLPAHHVTKHVKAAILKDRDLTTNVHYRTNKEGWDCEVLSRRLLDWLDVNATEKEDREHVTTKIAPGKPFPFKFADGKPSICHILNYYDESHIKTSIDTKEEYEAACRIVDSYESKRREAKRNGACMQ